MVDVDAPFEGAVRVRAWSSAADREPWDAYVRGHPSATFFHQSGWKRVLERTFGYPSHYLFAQRGASVCGVLPLFACRSIRGKRSLYSLPHTVYGGPVADDADAERALLDHARALGRSYGAASVEYRNRRAPRVALEPLPGFATFEKELPADPDQVYRTLPKKAREMVNQAVKRHKLTTEFTGDLDLFYDLLADSYQRLGTPVFPRRFFAAMREEFPASSSILLVRHQGEPVASVLFMVWRDTMMPLYSGEAPDVRHLKSSNLKYLRLMEHASARGLSRFDFGRSRLDNQGAVTFKCNQGFEVDPLPYQVDPLIPGAGGGASPNRGIFAKVRPLWSALPRRVARALGPSVVRYFP